MAKRDEKECDCAGGAYKLAGLVCILAALVAIVYITSLHSTTNIPPSNLSTISVSADGSASAVPSMAQIYVYMNATGATASAATMNLSNEIAAFNSSIAPYLDGNRSLIKSSSFSVTKPYVYNPYPPVYNSSNNGSAAPNVYNSTASGPAVIIARHIITPYVGSEYITVTLPLLSSLNPALASLSYVPGLYIESADAQLSSQQITALRSAALTGAVANATSQAQVLIGNAQIVSKNITIQNTYFYPQPVMLASGAATAAKSGSGTSQLVFNGTDSVTESVYAVFSYEK
jgi:uncharacterized protein YggE